MPNDNSRNLKNVFWSNKKIKKISCSQNSFPCRYNFRALCFFCLLFFRTTYCMKLWVKEDMWEMVWYGVVGWCMVKNGARLCRICSMVQERLPSWCQHSRRWPPRCTMEHLVAGADWWSAPVCWSSLVHGGITCSPAPSITGTGGSKDWPRRAHCTQAHCTDTGLVLFACKQRGPSL